MRFVQDPPACWRRRPCSPSPAAPAARPRRSLATACLPGDADVRRSGRLGRGRPCPALTYHAQRGQWRHRADALTVNLGFEYDKTITPTTALILDGGYDMQPDQRVEDAGRVRATWYVTGKWQAYTNAAHEFVASLGDPSGRSAAPAPRITGGDRYGSTTPTALFRQGPGRLADRPTFAAASRSPGSSATPSRTSKVKQIQQAPGDRRHSIAG